MATEFDIRISNQSQTQNAVSLNLVHKIRASLSADNKFNDNNSIVREYKIMRGFCLDIGSDLGVEVSDITFLGIFVNDRNFDTRANNLYRFTVQLGESVFFDTSCFVNANVDGFTDDIIVSFGSLEEITEINASLQIVLLTK